MRIKNHIILILIIILSLILTSCNKLNNSEINKDTIQVWCNFSIFGYRKKSLDYYITRNIRLYCARNKIPIEIIEYDPKVLSYEDYVFKRNLAALNGNIIIFDEVSTLFDLAKQQADYTKLEVYDSLLEPYKNRFCIPIGRPLKSTYIYNEILEYYDIDILDRPVITYTDYLELKQEMKKKGAKFELKHNDYYETVKYYLYKNGLLYVNRQNEILKDNNQLKIALKKSIFDMCKDIILYNESKLDDFFKIATPDKKGLEIYDTNSELNLKKVQECDYIPFTSIDPMWFIIEDVGDTVGRTYIIDYFTLNCGEYLEFKSPSFFMHKNITNEKIYDLADYILEQSGATYTLTNPPRLVYSVILYTDKILNDIGLNNKFEYIGISGREEINEEQKKIVNDTYHVLVKDKIKSKEIADEYFADIEIVGNMESLIYDTIHEIAGKLSGGSSIYNLSLNRFDENDEEINSLVDRKVDDFIQQLIVKLMD